MANTLRRTLPWSAISFLIAWTLIALGYQVRTDISIGLDSTWNGLIVGSHEPELTGTTPFRWTRESTAFLAPGIGSANWLLRLKLSSGPNPRQATIYANNQHLGTFPVYEEPAWYELHIPQSYVNLGSLRLDIKTQTFRPERDARDLGLAVIGIQMRPEGQLSSGTGIVIPAWDTSLYLSGSVAALVAMALWMGMSGRWALVCGLALASLQGFLVAYHRLAVTPYAPAILILSLATLAISTLSWWIYHSNLIRYILPVWALTGLGSFVLAATPLLLGAGRAVDLRIVWDAAQRLANGLPLYDWQAILTNHMGAVYKIPPLFAVLLAPSVTQTFTSVKVVWRLLSLVTFLSVLAGVARHYSLKAKPHVILALVALGFTFRPVYDTLNYGQVDLVLLGCLWSSMALARTRLSALGGALLSLAAMFKVYPAAFAGLLIVKRDWKGLLGFVIGSALIVAATVPFVGLNTYLFYFTQVLPRIGDGTAWVENQTFNGFLSRFITNSFSSSPGPTNLYIQAATYLWAALLLGASLFLANMGYRSGTSTMDIDFGLLATTLLISVPAAWIHYETILLLPISALALKYRAVVGSQKLTFFLALVAYTLLAFGNIWSFGPFLHGWASVPIYSGTVYQGLWRLVLSYKFFGMLALWTLLVMVKLRVRHKGAVA